MPPHLRWRPSDASPSKSRSTIDPRELARMFSAPKWLEDLGAQAWLLLGIGLVLVGVIWLLGEIETIVLPVVTGTIVAAVAGPVVSALARHGVPRAAGATLDLNPLAVLVVTIGAGSLFGMVGLVLGAPIASAAVHISRDLAAARAAAAASPTPD